MQRNSSVKRAGIVIVVAAIVVVAAAAVTYSSSGVKTLGPGGVLFVQAVGHQYGALVHKTGEARICVAVSSSNGPLEDLPLASFEIIILAVPPQGGAIEKKERHDLGKGLYNFDIVPAGKSQWAKGLYVFGIVVKSTVGWGTAVAELLIEVYE